MRRDLGPDALSIHTREPQEPQAPQEPWPQEPQPPGAMASAATATSAAWLHNTRIHACMHMCSRGARHSEEQNCECFSFVNLSSEHQHSSFLAAAPTFVADTQTRLNRPKTATRDATNKDTRTTANTNTLAHRNTNKN